MTIRIDESLRRYIDPLTEDEYAALERSLLEEGCRDALVLWGDLLVDGHNRYGICQKHGIAFQTVQNTRFRSMEDVHLWMIDNHLGRRSVSDYQRGVLALRKKEILAARARQAQDGPQAAPAALQGQAGAGDTDEPPSQAPSARAQAVLTRQALARAARLSSATLGQIEKIEKSAAPEVVEAVKAGMISINAAAEVAALPEAEQAAAASGGGKELRQLAKQLREARKPAKPKPAPEPPALPADATPEQVEIARLTHALACMTEERDQLKKKVQQLTIALAQARGGEAGPPF
ncbi:hypothetical protein V8Z80_00795 [Orrella sp. JC864]|uniref:hypothetical protein n=1 Tax=Orrella sp. JC864 TaxID=3120298 RepID=UPI0012BB966B